MDTHDLNLPKPHGGQAAVLVNPARFKIVAAGRRWGKDELAVKALFEETAEGEYLIVNNTIVVLPNHRMMMNFYQRCVEYIRVHDGFMHGGGQVPMIQFPNKARIMFFTPNTINLLAGDNAFGVKFAVLNEATLMDEAVWDRVQGILAPTKGKALLIGTPKPASARVTKKPVLTIEVERDWFRRAYYKAKYDPEWDYWHFNTGHNPHIDMADLGRLAVTMHPNAYRSEILGEFVVTEKEPEKLPMTREEYFSRFV